MSICDFKTIKVDLKNPTYIYNKKCKQNDTLILNFTVLEDSVPANLTGYTCMLKANKSKKAIEIRDATIDVNKVRLQCPTSTTQFAGDLDLELFFVNSTTSLQKTSFTISIEVESSVIGDSSGNVPQNIITPLEKLDQNLSQLSGKIAEATQTNNALTNTKSAADNTNSALNNTINNANTAKTSCNSATGNLNNAVNAAKGTIEDLKKSNSQYTDHINNMDIHVTKGKKDSWDANVLMTQQLLHLVDMLMAGTQITDEKKEPITTETGAIWTM